MRVLQVINSVDAVDGGPVEIALQLCSSLKVLGDEPELLVARCPQRAALERVGGVALHWPGPAIGRYSYSRAAQRWLRENMARFDAVVIHGVWQHGALCAAAAARRHRVPYFVFPHGALDEGLPAIYPVRHLKKVVYWHLAARSSLERAAGICFTGEQERDRAVAFRGRWKAIVVGGGIELPRLAAGEGVASLFSRFPALEGRRVVLYMGRLVALKGVDMLIRAFARARRAAPQCCLLIAGRGARRYEGQIVEVVRASGCKDSVILAGALEGGEKWAALEQAELFVLPSHRESFGVAVVEALAVGTPVLVSRCVGVAPIVERCGAGIVCADDEDDLARALERALREPLIDSAAARRCYEENFRGREMAARLRAAMSRAREGARPTS